MGQSVQSGRWCCHWIVFLACLTQPALSQIRYVSSTGTNTNPASATSWATATADLQGAINASSSGQQVWVKAGTYKPGGEGNTDRSVSFNLKTGVAIYGSFAGTETTTTSRTAISPSSTSVSTPTSILSGEMGNLSNITDNNFHIVKASPALGTSMGASTIMDGFRIEKGYASGSGFLEGDGAGMVLYANPGSTIVTPTIRNCTFINNTATYSGGGLFCAAGASNSTMAPVITNCVFESNTANSTSFGGGGICGYGISGGSSSLTISGSKFINNVAKYGGGIYTYFNPSFQLSGSEFRGNRATENGGGIYHEYPTGNTFTQANCLFVSNSARKGGGVWNNNGQYGPTNSPTPIRFTNCMFRTNTATLDAGAVYNYQAAATFVNCGFTGNRGDVNGGAIYNSGNTAFPGQFAQTFLNCSFTRNTAGGTEGHTGFGAIASVNFGAVYLRNCVVFGNGGAKTFYRDSGYITEVLGSSLFESSVTNYSGSGSVFTTVTSPFSDTSTLATTPCSPVLNGSTGVNSGNLGTTDLTGNARFVGSAADLGAVEYQSTSVPAVSGGTILSSVFISTTVCTNSPIPTIGSSDNGFSVRQVEWETSLNNSNSWSVVSGANAFTLASQGSMSISVGSVSYRRVSYNCLGNPIYSNVITFTQSNTVVNAGAIGGAVTVPSPQESVNTLTSLTAASVATTPMTLRWQQSENGTAWTDIPNSNAQSINLPALNTGGSSRKEFQFRRVATNACSLTAATAPVGVTVIATVNESRIRGKIVSGDGITGVANVTITAVRTTTGLAGSPGSWTYTTLSEADGTYNLAPLYYGLNAGVGSPGSVTASTFVVTPRLTSSGVTHAFNPTSATVTLNQTNIPRENLNFTDLTTYAVTGQVFQTCPDCFTALSGQTPLSTTITCPLDDVDLTIRQAGLTVGTTKTGLLAGIYGSYALAVSNPGNYTLTPAYPNLSFTPSFRAVSVSGNLYNQNFTSPTSQTIAGKLTAGCNGLIGTATLEFADILKDAAGNERISCFRKRVTTLSDGSYRIVLPPRKYKVSVVSFTATTGANAVSSTSLVAFINQQLPADSLIRDLTSATAVVTLNLTYERPPTLAVEGLVNPPSCGTASAFSIMEQAVDTPLTIRIFQGPANLGCPVSGGLVSTSASSGTGTSSTTTSGTLLISTTIQDDAGEVLRPGFISGVANLTLLPGNPNIIAPYTRTLNIQFTDKFGQKATAFDRPVVVTGTKPGAATFETVSPSIPFLVLHDPPGDLSSSFWEKDTKVETSLSFYSSRTYSQNVWQQLKLGIKFLSGIGISFKSKSGVQIDNETEMIEGRTRSHEMVLTTRMVEKISTSASPSVVGTPGDVFVGGAFNLIYSTATTVVPLAGTCSFTTVVDFIIANQGLATKFYYTEAFIREQVIPNLRNLRDLSTNTLQKEDYEQQVSVWEQILANNEYNKSIASFVGNKSFNGGVGEITEYTTEARTEKNSYETLVEVDETAALEAGFEWGGNGLSGGVKLKFKFEIGTAEASTQNEAVTTGYSLKDKDPNDRFTVDVKKNPVYGTPVFDLLAGETSCPAEPETRARDNFQFSATQNVVSNVPADGEAIFTLKLGNISEVITDGSRTATLELLEESNTSGAEIIVNGSPYVVPITYSLVRLAPETEVIVRVRRGNPSVFAHEGLKFKLSGCGGPGTSKTVTLSAFFLSPCSSASLVTPEPGWVSTLADNNQMNVQIGGYNVANLTDVTLEYTEASASNWQTGFTRTAAQLNSNPLINWNTMGIPNGAYALRLKVRCPLGNGGTGVVYSQRVEGVFDRTAPRPFGNTLPASDTYLAGSTIGISYDEPLRCSQISNGSVTAKRRSNGQTVPVSVGCYMNQIVIVPTSNILPFTGDVISLTLTGITDVYGNARTTPDAWEFYVGSSTAATGPGALSVTLTNSPLSESATGTMNVVFRLPQAAPNNIFVNFAVSGSAVHGLDYLTSFSPGQPLSATVNGAGGTIMIPTGATSVTLLIDPINDPFFEPDENIIITLLDGGDYGISAAASVTAVILNDDPVGGGNVITSIKTGNWEEVSTWDLNRTPLATDQVIIDQNHTVTLTGTGNARKVTKRSNAKLRMNAATRLRLGF